MLSGRMPKKPPREIPSSRHSYAAVAAEITRYTKAVRGRHKEIAGILHLTSQQLTHRIRGVQTELTIDEIGVIADWARAPLGWPLLSWDVAKGLEDALVRSRKGAAK